MTPSSVRDPHALTALRRRQASTQPASTAVISGGAPIGVIACPDAIGGRLSTWDRRVLGAARRIADATGTGVLVVARAELSDDVGAAGADAIATLQPGVRTDHIADVLGRIFQGRRASHLVFPDSESGGELGRRLAARMNVRPNTGVWRIKKDRAVCLTGWKGGEHESELSRVILLADGAEPPYTGDKRDVRPLPTQTDIPAKDAGARIVKEWRLSAADVDLQDAELVIGGGLGVLDWSKLKEVAGKVGASYGASRPVVDQGILPRSRQIGATGALLNARCYIALGISGAPQHLEGIKACDFVIGVNTDKNSPISRRADLFIQADADDVLAKMVDLVRERS